MLFQPPKTVETRVFATLPEELKHAPANNEWARTQPMGTPTCAFLEGPSFDQAGNLWCVDIQNGRILKVDPEGRFELVTQYDGWPNGLKFHRDGRAFVADYRNGIMVLDPVNGRIEPYRIRHNAERFKGVNDLFFASNGDLYFTDQGLTGLHDPTGRLFRLTGNGTLTCLLDNIPSPNGLVMNRNESVLYVAVTRGNCVWRVPFLPNGDIAKVGVFVQLSGGGGPDGLALDEQGGLVVAHVGLGSVWVFDALGEPAFRVRSCTGTHTTNVAFGVRDRKTLYITESETGTILRAELPVAGKPMFSHA
ncbi:MAG: SMP-30/gluconolactonase/LRE family protein [Betaproteobacteria bacterium]|nr:SMP-30/gluconolactonase/LRE family protein [Betaproteobacteria bacterium]